MRWRRFPVRALTPLSGRFNWCSITRNKAPPYLSYTSSVVSKSPHETTIAGLRLARRWSAAEARGTWGRRQPLEYILKKNDRAEDGKQIAWREREVAKKGEGKKRERHRNSLGTNCSPLRFSRTLGGSGKDTSLLITLSKNVWDKEGSASDTVRSRKTQSSTANPRE